MTTFSALGQISIRVRINKEQAEKYNDAAPVLCCLCKKGMS